MASTGAKWLKGCGLSCGCAVVVVILAAVGGSVVLIRPFREAVAMRETLAERHGAVDDFTPWPDGAIPPDRVEAFLLVRQAVQASCAEVAASSDALESLDQLDADGEPDAAEVLGAFGEASKSLFAMGPVMGGFFRARNAALLEADMGLGEYSYLYAVAYGPTLAGPATGAEGPFRGARLSRRVRETLRRQLRNRLAAMDAEPGVWEGSDERRRLAEEIAVLEEDTARLPWQGGRPPALAASLAPHEERLAALFCAEATDLELVRNRSRGLSIHGD